MTSSYDTIRSETCTKEPSILILHWHYLCFVLSRCHMIKLTHVLGHRGSEFPNIINTDCRTIQIVLFMLHLRRGTDFTHTWPRMTPGLISHVHNSFEVYLWQTRHTSGHFNMNAGGRETMESKARREMRFYAGFHHAELMWAAFEVSAVCEMSC